MIKDSGNRTKFDSGAVRDIQEGKGRCDLLPLTVIGCWCEDSAYGMLGCVDLYRLRPSTEGMSAVLNKFASEHRNAKDVRKTLERYRWELVLEVAKHFEEGAKKYGDRNWEKGIPCYRYIDSAVRHYCKWRAGWTDEPHDRAFIWNILCCEWTRQRYGWNLERLEKKSAMSPHNILGMKTSLLDIPWRYDEAKSESKKGVEIGKQLSKGIQDGLKQASSLYGEEAAEKMRWCCSQLTQTESVSKEGIYDNVSFNDDTEITMSVEGDFSELFNMLDVEEPVKDQEIDENSDIKAVLETMKKSLGCKKLRRENFRKCLDTVCSECEYNTEPFVDIDSDALQTLIDYVEKTLKVQERHNPCVKDTDTGWHFYDIDGRLVAYIFDFKEPEEGKRRQLGRMLHKVWREVTGNLYTIERIVEEWGYICGRDFSICIAPSEAVKEYDLSNRKYNEED